ncbi:MAG: AbrB/MazE/SpoVT family DNA-binding domain-containing protein [Elusimicrobia bacterium]|nr:AbrB/MazE/SpoVT family DNA-binding domain-containing protein [Elusimicrobiota bacterium]
MQTWSSHVGAKFQVTLPKKVRDILGIRNKGEIIGFVADGSKVFLTKAEITPQADPFTEDEWAKMLRLSESRAKKTSPAKEFLRRHRRLTR